MDPGLRPTWSLVALYAGCGSTHNHPFYAAGWSQGETTLVRHLRCIGSCRGCYRLLQDASRARSNQLCVWCGVRGIEDRLDRSGCGVSLRHFCRDRAIRNHERVGRKNHSGPPAASSAGCFLFWSLHRGSSRIWGAGGNRRRFHDWTRFQTIPCRCVEFDREHSTCGMGSNRYAGSHACGSNSLPESDLNAMIGRILPFTAIIVPFWLVRTMVSWKETFEVFPAILVVGISFALTQFFWSNYVDSNLVDIMGGVISIIAVLVFLRFWKPKKIWRFDYDDKAPVRT